MGGSVNSQRPLLTGKNVKDLKELKECLAFYWKPGRSATERHLPYGITQCYLPPDTGERAPP